MAFQEHRTWHSKSSRSKGNSCPFSNRGKGRGRSTSPKGERKTDRGGNASLLALEVCPYHLKGKCRKGDKCDLKHNGVCSFWKTDGSSKIVDKSFYLHRDAQTAMLATGVVDNNKKPGTRRVEERRRASAAVTRARQRLRAAWQVLHLRGVSVLHPRSLQSVITSSPKAPR